MIVHGEDDRRDPPGSWQYASKCVGDMTIGYDPPRRCRVIPVAGHNEKAQEDVEDGGS